jgi:hypothetical protein
MRSDPTTTTAAAAAGPGPGNAEPEAWTAELEEVDREFARRELARLAAALPTAGGPRWPAKPR